MYTYVHMKSKSNIDCTALCCMPQTMALVLLLKNLRVLLTTLSTASLLALTSSAKIGGSLIVCCGEPKPFYFFLFFDLIWFDSCVWVVIYDSLITITTQTNEWFRYEILVDNIGNCHRHSSRRVVDDHDHEIQRGQQGSGRSSSSSTDERWWWHFNHSNGGGGGVGGFYFFFGRGRSIHRDGKKVVPKVYNNGWGINIEQYTIHIKDLE